MKYQLVLAIFVSVLFTRVNAQAVIETDADHLATLRNAPLSQSVDAPNITNAVDNDIRMHRNYPMQAPLIPHSIDNYQVSINVNKCLTCHSRRAEQASNAPPVSVTHYQDRDTNFLAEVSPRRYFCSQCHVVQTNAQALVGNHFQDVDAVISAQQREQKESD